MTITNFTDTKQEKLFFCFIHIPKCGGTTFHDILKRNLGDSYQNIYHGLYEGSIPSYNLKLYIEESSIRTGIGGHRLSLDLPFFDCKKVDIKAISFIREPIERIRSEYFYVKSLSGNIGQNSNVRNYDYSEYLQYLIDNQSARDKIGKYQLKFLFGKLQPSFKRIEKLVASKNLFLFPLDKFDLACLLLEKEFPGLLKDASFFKQNVRYNHQKQSLNDLEKKLNKLIIDDKKLYNIADKQLNNLISSYYTPKELKKAKIYFHHRCLKRKYIYSPFQEFSRKIYRLSSSW